MWDLFLPKHTNAYLKVDDMPAIGFEIKRQALEELIFQPHVKATECGGGPTNSQGWRDKDEDKDKWKLQQQTKYKPSKRRR